MSTLTLNRLAFTDGGIDAHTPDCVVDEIITTLGIENSRQPRNDILITPSPVINLPFKNTDDRFKAAWYVNPQPIKWDSETLKTAFLFLLWLQNTPDYFPREEMFDIGNQTPSKPRSLNACVLFRICRRYQITTSRSTTIEEMRTMILWYRESTSSILDHIKTLNITKGELVSLLRTRTPPTKSATSSELSLDNHPTIDDDQFYKLSQLSSSINEIGFLRRSIKPKTREMAIAIAALEYKIDLSYCRNPIQECANLIRCQSTDTFIFTDPWCSYWQSKNRSMFNLFNEFQANIPREYYSEQQLSQLASIYCIDQRADIYSELVLRYLGNDFYIGLRPGIINKQSFLNIDTINELNSSEIVCYGGRSTGYKFSSYGELIDYFSTTQQLINPFTDPYRENKTLFPVSCIRRFINILNNEAFKSTSVNTPARTLAVLLDELLQKQDIGEHLKLLDDKHKEQIIIFLNLVLKLGLTSRGWKEGRNYPLKLRDAPPPKTQEDEQEIFFEVLKVVNSINVLLIGMDEQIIKNIGTLQLLLYDPNTKSYIKSNDNKNGVNIIDRINIIKNDQGEPSCIRLSSNWFLSSSYCYLNVLGVKPFNIDELERLPG